MSLKFYRRVRPPPEYPGKVYSAGHCLEHHLVWWQNTGQVVPEGFVVHHKNENKLDNRFENLELLPLSDHTEHHLRERLAIANPDNPTCRVTLVCAECNRDFRLTRAKHRTRLANSNSGKLFCSKSCSVKTQWEDGNGKKKRAPDGDLRHGESVTYTYYKCRCGICREGQRLRMQGYLARKKFEAQQKSILEVDAKT